MNLKPEKKRAGKDNKEGGARGGDLKKGKPALFFVLRFLGRSLLMVSPSQAVRKGSKTHKERERRRSHATGLAQTQQITQRKARRRSQQSVRTMQ